MIQAKKIQNRVSGGIWAYELDIIMLKNFRHGRCNEINAFLVVKPSDESNLDIYFITSLVK